ncbi:hypothetical protein PtA15_2A148 [Puccinia triticina]|uniref:Uncharacterized protein n=1 Tax=Puccinia triticina TaxID=208348 RepID=A0ABY7CCG3_9BASI|nr:uncharacterized protein PtA15_2A148 [Puccinia triticina]WAQ81836.1 hypothetical protein PtA15_2A148 [Puccinia triticina]WAR52724.1 hypothetical protein PtB15_2B149 [Puccinia triticina]
MDSNTSGQSSKLYLSILETFPNRLDVCNLTKTDFYLVSSQEEIRVYGIANSEKLWTKYVLNSSFSKSASTTRARVDPARRLRDKLYNWSKWIESRRMKRLGYTQMEPNDELTSDDLRVNYETVELAINFHIVSMVMKSYHYFWSVVNPMAIFQTAQSFPKSVDAAIEKFFSSDVEGLERLKAFCAGVHSDLNQEEGFYQILAKIIPEPYRIANYSFKVLNAWIDTCRREYILMSELIAVCLDVGPTMAAQDRLFWEQLEMLAARENFQPLLFSYKELCKFLEKGLPIDRLFEYYQLIKKITGEMKRFGDDQTRACMNAKVLQLQGHDVSTDPSLRKYVKMDGKEIATRVLRDKLNLLMNYAEELHHQRTFQPAKGLYSLQPRANPTQLTNIKLLLLDLLSPDNVISPERVTLQISYEVFRSNLPYVIKHKICLFGRFLEDGVEAARRKTSEIQRKTHENWDRELAAALHDVRSADPMSYVEIKTRLKDARTTIEESEANLSELDPDQMKTRIKEYNASVKEALRLFHLHNHPQSMIHLQYSSAIRKAMRNATEREFSTMSTGAAATLIGLLRRIHRFVQNFPVLDRIYYAMIMTPHQERKDLVKKVRERLLESEKAKSETVEKMPSKEIWTVNKLLDLIDKKKQNDGYPVWKEEVLPGFLYLPTYLVSILGDIFADCSRSLVLQKHIRLSELVEGHLNQELHNELRDDLLSDETKEEFKGFLQDLAEKHVRVVQEKHIVDLMGKSPLEHRLLMTSRSLQPHNSGPSSS